MSENLKCALDLLQNCIHNGHEVKKICDDSPDKLKSNELIRQFIEKINDETKSLENVREKFFVMLESNNKKDYTKLKEELQNMMNSMDSISSENVNQVIEALMRSKTSKASKKLTEHEVLVKDFKGDDVTKNFVNYLIERNHTIIKCLNHIIHMLPQPQKVNCKEAPKTKRKLFILSDDLQKTIAPIDKSGLEKIGTVTIQSDGNAHQSLTIASQTMSHRRFINGILQDEISGIEVILELREPSSDATNLSDLSSTLGKLSASIAIDGHDLEDIEVFEISIKEVNEAIAVVENERTGRLHEVSVRIEPNDVENNIHGRIVEFKSPERPRGKKILIFNYCWGFFASYVTLIFISLIQYNITFYLLRKRGYVIYIQTFNVMLKRNNLFTSFYFFVLKSCKKYFKELFGVTKF